MKKQKIIFGVCVFIMAIGFLFISGMAIYLAIPDTDKIKAETEQRMKGFLEQRSGAYHNAEITVRMSDFSAEMKDTSDMRTIDSLMRELSYQFRDSADYYAQKEKMVGKKP